MRETIFLRIFKDTWEYMPDIDIDGDSSILTSARGNDEHWAQDPRDLYGREVFMPMTLGGVFLPHVWMTIVQEKNLVETVVTERRGTVIELISHVGHRIALKGVVFNPDGSFPEEQVSDLFELAERNESVEMQCALTDIFMLTPDNNGETKVVIKSFTLLENRGVRNARTFEMELITDHNLELTLT